MKKIIFTIVLLFGFLKSTVACSCVMGKPNFMLFALSEVVFKGKIRSITQENSDQPKKITFSIRKSYKWIQEETVITIFTNPNSGMCGIGGKVGDKFLIFAKLWKDGNLWTDICMHSGLIKRTQAELSMLNSISRIGNKWIRTEV
jgi:hypothetical protein